MTNKCLAGGQWPLDIQSFDYERMFGCFPKRTDGKGQSYCSLFPQVPCERGQIWVRTRLTLGCGSIWSVIEKNLPRDIFHNIRAIGKPTGLEKTQFWQGKSKAYL